MKLRIAGEEIIEADREALWRGLNDPDVLVDCIPGCRRMTETAPDHYTIELQLKVAAVGGSFEGEVALLDKTPPERCRLTVSGSGSLGHGTGAAEFTIAEAGSGRSTLTYEGEGEIGGLVAGVGQRVLGSVAKHLTKQFFTALKKRYAADPAAASR